jgi:integrase
MRGMGRIYRRGTTFWIQYSHRGRIFRESSHSDREAVARKLLKKRLGEIGLGRFVGPDEEKITFDEMVSTILTDYQMNNRRSIRGIKLSIQHLRSWFGMDRALDISSDRVKKYVIVRQEEGAANSSINYELAVLKRMFRLTIKNALLPEIKLLEVSNARQGFVDPADFNRLHAALPESLQDAIRFLYLSGWRVGEMRSLEWRDVNLSQNEIQLRLENSKNKRPRILALGGELTEIFARTQNRRRLDCPFVFHRDGKPIGDIRKVWATACRAAGLRLLVHDLRRSAIRNMVRSGTPEGVAMSISGHQTRSVFERYNIVSKKDQEAAIARQEMYLSAHSGQEPKVVRLPLAKEVA